MSRPAVWLLACAAGPWLLAGVWTLLEARAHLLDRAVWALTVRRD